MMISSALIEFQVVLSKATKKIGLPYGSPFFFVMANAGELDLVLKRLKK
jgi:hypothetical protein